MDTGQIILFQTQGGDTKIEVRLANETVWLTAEQMGELFQRDRSTIQRHIKKIYEEGELTSDSTCAFFAQVVWNDIKYTKLALWGILLQKTKAEIFWQHLS